LNDYQNTLNKNGILKYDQNSDPYENAVAERINGILKRNQFMIDKYNLDLKS
jgi:hypothetical protein